MTTTTKRIQDPLGRSAHPAPHMLVGLCVTAAITGSAWPIYARSVRPALDSLEPPIKSLPIPPT
jgi:hypothetical protein